MVPAAASPQNNRDEVTIIGGGISGLCAAYYLQKRGFKIRIIDRGSITDGCSFGNMGYLSPSHFMPLASPGIIAEGLKYILNKQSPFYIKPRLNVDFLKWGWDFYRSSRREVAEKNAPYLSNLLQLSRRLMNDIRDELGDVFDMQEIGCMMMCHKQKAFEYELKLADKAELLGLSVERLSRQDVQDREPDVEVDVAGAVLFKDDAHIDPGKFMLALKNHLEERGVIFQLNTEVTGFHSVNNSIQSIFTSNGDFKAGVVVLTPGSWLPELGKLLGIKIMLQGGKGYSYTYNQVEKNIKYPAILVDGRCAITPWQSKLRIGGTMEFSGLNSRVLYDRMIGIYNSVKSFYPGLEIQMPPEKGIWTGLRPVTPDGLPYIGRHEAFKNLVIAGGHAMLGISAGAGTGLTLSEILTQEPTSIEISPFRVNRF